MQIGHYTVPSRLHFSRAGQVLFLNILAMSVKQCTGFWNSDDCVTCYVFPAQRQGLGNRTTATTPLGIRACAYHDGALLC